MREHIRKTQSKAVLKGDLIDDVDHCGTVLCDNG